MLQLRKLNKQFGAFQALHEVDFAVNGGEIVGLLGENGAGKSTLLNIVGGHLQPSSGELLWHEQPVTFTSPREASNVGIGVVHQHPRLVEAFTAGENIALASSSYRRGLFRRKEWDERVQTWAASLGWRISTGLSVEQLSVGERQRIEILKALFARTGAGVTNDDGIAQLLLLDEPTANLTPGEADELFTVMRRLREQGRGLVFVSHKLNEVLAICDRVVVLRRGKVVGERLTLETDADDLARLMIGDSSSAETASSERTVAPDAPVRLRIEKLSAGLLRDFSLQVRAGEIVALAGVDGNGQAELIEALSGTRASTGDIVCDSPLAIIPPDRERTGLIADFDLAENLALHPAVRERSRHFARFDWANVRTLTRDLMARYDVRAPQTADRTFARQLSGGNQQKLLIARALEFPHGAVIAADPTRGLDVGAARFVHNQLRQAAASGAAVLLVSTDLDEVLALGDRFGVLYEGRLLPDAQLLPHSTSRETIGALMGGKIQSQAA